MRLRISWSQALLDASKDFFDRLNQSLDKALSIIGTLPS